MEANASKLICIWKGLPALASISPLLHPVQPREFENGVLEGKPEVRGLSRCFDAFGFALQSDFGLKEAP